MIVLKAGIITCCSRIKSVIRASRASTGKEEHDTVPGWLEPRCFEIEKAERKLAEHVALKYQPSSKERDIELIDVADVLAIYLDDTGDRQASRAKFEGRIGRLNDYWGGKTLAEVTGETCYVRKRGTRGGAQADWPVVLRSNDFSS